MSSLTRWMMAIGLLGVVGAAYLLMRERAIPPEPPPAEVVQQRFRIEGVAGEHVDLLLELVRTTPGVIDVRVDIGSDLLDLRVRRRIFDPVRLSRVVERSGLGWRIHPWTGRTRVKHAPGGIGTPPAGEANPGQ